MWFEFFSIFRKGDSMKVLVERFQEMFILVQEMFYIVRSYIFDQDLSLEERVRVYKLDVWVNKFEWSICKWVVSYVILFCGHVLYCLFLMILVKDVECIGDYLKNISEVVVFGAGTIPQGFLKDELCDLIAFAMNTFDEMVLLFEVFDREKMEEILQMARLVGKCCD